MSKRRLPSGEYTVAQVVDMQTITKELTQLQEGLLKHRKKITDATSLNELVLAAALFDQFRTKADEKLLAIGNQVPSEKRPNQYAMLEADLSVNVSNLINEKLNELLLAACHNLLNNFKIADTISQLTTVTSSLNEFEGILAQYEHDLDKNHKSLIKETLEKIYQRSANLVLTEQATLSNRLQEVNSASKYKKVDKDWLQLAEYVHKNQEKWPADVQSQVSENMKQLVEKREQLMQLYAGSNSSILTSLLNATVVPVMGTIANLGGPGNGPKSPRSKSVDVSDGEIGRLNEDTQSAQSESNDILDGAVSREETPELLQVQAVSKMKGPSSSALKLEAKLKQARLELEQECNKFKDKSVSNLDEFSTLRKKIHAVSELYYQFDNKRKGYGQTTVAAVHEALSSAYSIIAESPPNQETIRTQIANHNEIKEKLVRLQSQIKNTKGYSKERKKEITTEIEQLVKLFKIHEKALKVPVPALQRTNKQQEMFSELKSLTDNIKQLKKDWSKELANQKKPVKSSKRFSFEVEVPAHMKDEPQSNLPPPSSPIKPS